MEQHEKKNPVVKGIAFILLTIGILLVITDIFSQGREWSGIVLRTFGTLGIALVISSLITLFVS